MAFEPKPLIDKKLMLALLNTSNAVKICKTDPYNTIIFVVKTLPMEQKCFLVIAPLTMNYVNLARRKHKKKKKSNQTPIAVFMINMIKF